jgi:iron complex outermembrane recepter protein
MRLFCLLNTLIFITLTSLVSAQSTIKGTVLDEKSEAIPYGAVMLKSSVDSTLVKGAITNETGIFTFEMIPAGNYFVEVNFMGYTDHKSEKFVLSNQNLTLPTINMSENAKLMDEVVVSAIRPVIEVRADRTVFNVQGTINASGQSGVNLLRKAPGVLVDNNNNINVLGRSGVLVYIDGKRLPLAGDDLTNYLNTLTSEQIDRIEVITSPGAKYEAQGNAGIIDIKLKKDQNLGSNGTLSTNLGHGRYASANANITANYRNKKVNIFGNGGGYGADNWNIMRFTNYQSNIRTEDDNVFLNHNSGYNGRIGTDYFINKYSTLGFLVGGAVNDATSEMTNKTLIFPNNISTSPDSILQSPNTGISKRNQGTANINYAFAKDKNKLSIDLDYGQYNNKSDQNQPNYYYNADGKTLRSQNINFYTTPVDIMIATAKTDYETEVLGGSLGLGVKYSQVETDNTFLFYNVINNVKEQNNKRSNRFLYDEKVKAIYANYAKTINPKWSYTGGLRIESTNAQGDLNAFLPSLEELPVVFDYTDYFPSAGFTYNHAPAHSWSLNYGRRINRPDYNVLNPFREQISELSYSKGNKSLKPEKMHNIDLSYTLKYMYNFKLSYSRTDDQITRLIGPDELDPRAGFISWDNLATQDLYVLSASIPHEVNKWWSVYLNATASYTDNQATYDNGSVVDVQVGSYNFYQQSTFILGKGFKGEVSGWYAGPGVWGGVFLYESQYSLDLGIQKKFLKDKLNVRLGVSDITYQSGWSGVSEFNGLRGEGFGNYDSRRASLSLSYDFGNSNVKSRKRSTGLESESKRVGG